MTPYPKIKTKKSAAYEKFIRSKPCMICGGPARFAHQNLGYGCMGGKSSSIQGLPLCDDCHNMGEKSEHSGQIRFWANHFRLYGDECKPVLIDEYINGLKAMEMLKLLNEFLGTGGKL